MQLTRLLASALVVFAVGVQATHQLGSSCSGGNIGTFGCSNDECTVIKCVPGGNGNHYWQYEESCIHIKCENGACDKNVPKDSCTKWD